MTDNLISWCHVTLNHIGMTQLRRTIATHFHHPRLKAPAEQRVANCNACQCNEAIGPGCGELPERDAQLLPWNEVASDLIGPWKISADRQELEFNALTCTDPVTNLVKLTRTQNKTAAAHDVGVTFENAWLSRCPRPTLCIHDHGGKLAGADFKRTLELNGAQDVPTSVKNLQLSATCERAHHTAASVLHALSRASSTKRSASWCASLGTRIPLVAPNSATSHLAKWHFRKNAHAMWHCVSQSGNFGPSSPPF